MSSKENKSREEVVAAREAKKLAKQKVKSKEPGLTPDTSKTIVKERKKSTSEYSKDDKPSKKRTMSQSEAAEQKSKDEVDKASVAPVNIKTEELKTAPAEKDKDKIQADRAMKKAAKQAQKKGKAAGDNVSTSTPVGNDMTVEDVVVALRDIKQVAIGVKDITAEVKALDLKGKKGSIKTQVLINYLFVSSLGKKHPKFIYSS